MSRFSRLEETREEWKERKDTNKKLAYERKIVRKLVTSLGYTKFQKALDTPDNDDDKNFMSIAWLHDGFPTLPIRLTAHESDPTRLSEFFTPGSRKSKLWQGWAEARTCLGGELDAGTDIGWVFTFLDDPELGDMIMHTLDLNYLPEGTRKPFTRMHCVFYDGLSVTLETFKSFIVRMRPTWTANDG